MAKIAKIALETKKVRGDLRAQALFFVLEHSECLTRFLLGLGSKMNSLIYFLFDLFALFCLFIQKIVLDLSLFDSFHQILREGSNQTTHTLSNAMDKWAV